MLEAIFYPHQIRTKGNIGKRENKEWSQISPLHTDRVIPRMRALNLGLRTFNEVLFTHKIIDCTEDTADFSLTSLIILLISLTRRRVIAVMRHRPTLRQHASLFTSRHILIMLADVYKRIRSNAIRTCMQSAGPAQRDPPNVRLNYRTVACIRMHRSG